MQKTEQPQLLPFPAGGRRRRRAWASWVEQGAGPIGLVGLEHPKE
jgi:hypothetical protein